MPLSRAAVTEILSDKNPVSVVIYWSSSKVSVILVQF